MKNMGKVMNFFRTWMLPISITAGILLYLLYRAVPCLHPAGPFFAWFIPKLQPALLFAMLFLSFSKISPRELRFRKWHIWLLLIQTGSFIAISLALALLPDFGGKVVAEAFMLCLICPTATAAAVVTDKLGGEMPGLITYLVLINLAVSIVVPLFVPMVHPSAKVTFFTASAQILAKVFPTLIGPAALAWLVQWLCPELHRRIVSHKDTAFYVWAFSLCLAILMTTRAICNSGTSLALLGAIAGVSLLSCIFQFWAGRKIGAHYGDDVTVGQSLGQKNTVMSIWMGYMFFDPATSVAGGFYSIWHNCYNSWQLYRKQKRDLVESPETDLRRS